MIEEYETIYAIENQHFNSNHPFISEREKKMAQ